jgi:hypothetical protein
MHYITIWTFTLIHTHTHPYTQHIYDCTNRPDRLRIPKQKTMNLQSIDRLPSFHCSWHRENAQTCTKEHVLISKARADIHTHNSRRLPPKHAQTYTHNSMCLSPKHAQTYTHNSRQSPQKHARTRPLLQNHLARRLRYSGAWNASVSLSLP